MPWPLVRIDLDERSRDFQRVAKRPPASSSVTARPASKLSPQKSAHRKVCVTWTTCTFWPVPSARVPMPLSAATRICWCCIRLPTFRFSRRRKCWNGCRINETRLRGDETSFKNVKTKNKQNDTAAGLAELRSGQPVAVEMKSSKLQHPSSREAPNFKLQTLRIKFVGAWCLKFLWMLELGIWSFQIGCKTLS